MGSLDEFTAYSQKNQYQKMKWKLRFDAFKERLPVYYNDYLNSCLKFVDSRLRSSAKKSVELPSQIQSLMLTPCEQIYRNENRELHEIFKQVRKHQADLEYRDENHFHQSKADHERYSAMRTFRDKADVPLLCC